MNMARNNVDGSKWSDDFEIFCILQGFGFAFSLLIVISFVLAIIVYFSSWVVNLQILAVLTSLSVLLGAFWAGRMCERKAFLHGIGVGIFCYIVLGLMIDQKLFITWAWWQGFIKMILISMLGGILGGLLKQ